MGLFDRFRRRPTGGPAGVRARLEGAMAKRRLRGWNPPLENINALVASGGPRLLARSRELVVTNGYAANACEAFAREPRRRRDQAVLADWGRRPPRPGAEALARLDRRGRRRRADRLLWPAGHGRAGDVRRRRVLRPAPAPSRGRRAARPAAAAASPVRDAALREDGDGGQWQSHPLRNRVRCDRPACGLPLPPAPSGRQHRPGGGDPGDGARAGDRRAAHLSPYRRRPDPGAAAYRAGHGAAVPARAVRRR